ncbi:odorant binding protein 5 [Danaus plexippus plexippus]|uniref:Odorant binding protein 5 n=1 Tax=Danaus plexippus plexippus TaxID=278856 RepID=A0A212FB92_DANPL|nr:odorant binding protein 5 [Danaus plexippus plexippus]
MPSLSLLLYLAMLTLCYGAKEKPELSEEIKEIIQHVHNECVGKTGVAEEDIANCENGIFKEDMKLKCYMFCLLEEGSLVDDDGNVDYDMMVSLIPDQYTDRVLNMINGCKHLVLSISCDDSETSGMQVPLEAPKPSSSPSAPHPRRGLDSDIGPVENTPRIFA